MMNGDSVKKHGQNGEKGENNDDGMKDVEAPPSPLPQQVQERRSIQFTLKKVDSARHFKSSGGSKKQFGGFGELSDAVKLHRKIGASLNGDKYEMLDRLYSQPSQSSVDNRTEWVKEQELKFHAREKVARQMVVLTLGLFIFFLFCSILFFIHVAGMTLQEAMLYSAYTITSTGFGMIKPEPTTGFLLFATFFMYAGVAFIVVSAFEIYLYISMETSNIKRHLDRHRAAKMLADDPGAAEDPAADPSAAEDSAAPAEPAPTEEIQYPSGFFAVFADCTMSCVNFLATTARKSECGRLAVIGGYLVLLFVGGSLIMMILEDWSFTQALYFGTYVMTTVGYGDVTPATSAGIWFTVFWLPLNVTFVSIYMGNLGRYYMIFGNAMSQRLYEKESKKSSSLRQLQLDRLTASIPWKDDTGTKQWTMRDAVELVLESFYYLHQSHNTDKGNNEIDQSVHGDHGEPRKNLMTALKLESPWASAGHFYSNRVRKPSLALLVLVQERLARIIVEETVGKRSHFVEKDLTFSFTIDGLQATIHKWKIPAGAQEAFSIAAFEVMVSLGEKRIVVDGANAILNLTPEDCHDLLSPVLAALEDAGTMEGWLASTEELAQQDTYISAFSRELPARLHDDETNSDGNETKNTGQNGTATKNKAVMATANTIGKDHLGQFEMFSSDAGIAKLAKLRTKYYHTLEDIQVLNHAQYRSNLMLFVVAVSVLLVYQTLICWYVVDQADVQVNYGVMFVVYTLTSAGFGNVPIPQTDAFLGFAIVNVFISITQLAVVIAQTLMFWSFQSVRRKHVRDKVLMAASGRAVLSKKMGVDGFPKTVRDAMCLELSKAFEMMPPTRTVNSPSPVAEQLSDFLLRTSIGRKVLVAGTLFLLLAIFIIGSKAIEGWSFVQSLYFSTFALLTVGHGDLTPVTNAGIWYVNCFLPFNVLFVSLYIGSAAHIYVQLREKRINAIEAQMRRAPETSLAAPNDAGPKEKSVDPGLERRRRIKQNSTGRLFDDSGTELLTAKDLLRKLDEPKAEVDSSNSSNNASPMYKRTASGVTDSGNDDPATVLTRYQTMLQSASKHDHFMLRLAVLDRLARVVHLQLRDFQATIEIEGDKVRLSVESLKDWTDKWKIPHRARSIYREITFEALLLVGEKAIFDRGVGAFFDLSVIEFIELFSPFAFALGDSKIMHSWMTSTDDLAMNRLASDEDDLQIGRVKSQLDQRRFVKNTVESFFPVNPGNAGRVLLE